MVGGSAGLNVAAAIKLASTLEGPATIVTVSPDSGVKYLSKIYNSEWLKANGFEGVQYNQRSTPINSQNDLSSNENLP